MFGFDISNNPVQPIKRSLDEPVAIVDTDNPPEPSVGGDPDDTIVEDPIYPDDTTYTRDDILVNATLSAKATEDWINTLPQEQKTGLYILAGIIAYNIFLK